MSLPYLPPFQYEFCPSTKRANPHRCYTQEEAHDLAEERTRPGQLWTFWACARCRSYHVGKPSRQQIRNFRNAMDRQHPEIAKALDAYLQTGAVPDDKELSGDSCTGGGR